MKKGAATFKEELMRQREELAKLRGKPEYQQRHIGTIKPVSSWHAQDIEVHKKHNRILQHGYSELDPDTIIDLAISTKEDWITDFLCPKVEHACKLNIAADLITRFKITSEDLNSIVQNIYKKIASDPVFFTRITADIEARMQDIMPDIRIKAQQMMQRKYPGSNDPSLLDRFILVETQKAKKRITHAFLKQSLLPLYPKIADEIGIEPKPTCRRGENIDFSILGAAGSGKSTISDELVGDQRIDFVVLATDDYREVFLSEEGEQLVTDQVFIRTQDTAYSIKELVQERLTSDPKGDRPNLVIDCVSLEGWHRELLENNRQTISAVACLNDVSLVPERAYKRAISETSRSADRGRHVNTSALLRGHAFASAFLLTSIPYNVTTHLYDTNVPRGTHSRPFAAIDTQDNKHLIVIDNLDKFSWFLVKANINQEATYKGELYYESNKEYAYTFDSQYRAKQILKLVSAKPPHKMHDYNLVLKSKATEIPYVRIFKENGKIQLEILDLKTLLNVLNGPDENESWIFQNIIMQMHLGSLKTVRKEIKEQGRAKVLSAALAGVIPEVLIIKENKRPHKVAFGYDSRSSSPDQQSHSSEETSVSEYGEESTKPKR